MIGTLPASWGGDGAFLAVTVLAWDITSLTGTLPPSWRGPSSFPALNVMQLTTDVAQLDRFAGSLPPECSSTTAFLQLLTLEIGNCSINITCPTKTQILCDVVDDQNLMCAHAHSTAECRAAACLLELQLLNSCLHGRSLT